MGHRLVTRAAEAPLVWLDSTRYAAKLLAAGAPPWLDVAETVAWLRKTDGLLGSDVVGLPLGEVCAAWCRHDEALRMAMALPSRRSVAPLRTLFASERLRAHVVALAAGLRGAFPGRVLALSLPSPRLAVGWAQALVERVVDVDDDAVDTAAMYGGDFLRVFAAREIDALLLEETAATEPRREADLALYAPLLNVGAHYRWDVGIRLPHALFDLGAVPDFVVAPRALGSGVVGLALGADFWDGAAPGSPPRGGFRFAEIPGDARPETVLARLATLR